VSAICGQPGAPGCPVCEQRGDPLLTLQAQPIYQHPVPADVVVPAPHTVDLSWVSCAACGHAWQPRFDRSLLEVIYRSHYYTPAPDGLAVQFRNDFMALLLRLGLVGQRRVLLEIGASDGELLADIKNRSAADCAYAFEPNADNAAVARRRGLDVLQEFFGRKTAQAVERADLVYARHVIEHVFDFEDFFDGLQMAAADSADLVLETPSLDHHADRGSIAPFHIEHIHVFSARSLAKLASTYGWVLRHAEVTSAGNLIAWFRRGGSTVEPRKPALSGLQESVAARHVRLRTLLAGRRLIFWGAGSAGVTLAGTIGREPELWTDGNPAKVGKRFVGLASRIVAPESAFAMVRAQNSDGYVLVIASSFVEEILPVVRSLGWDGEIFDADGIHLQGAAYA